MVVAALGANVVVLLKVSLVQHAVAAGALNPQALGHLVAFGGAVSLHFGGE